MKSKLHTTQCLALLALFLVSPASLRAGAVADWNEITVQTVVTAGRPGATGLLDVATVQAAVYDAVQAIENRFEPYYVEVPGASGSPAAAAATAAHDVLVNRFPAQAASVDATYQQYLLSKGLSASDPGVAVGEAAAGGIIALRACDGSFPNPEPPPFTGGTAPGVWRPTPPSFLPMLAPWLANVTPFFLTRPSQFRAMPPPALTSSEYTKDYNEVKAVGELNSSSRTAEQTDMAYFWATNYVIVMNQTLRRVAAAHIDHIAQSSRLFALANMAAADAIITAWNAKVRYVAWRPITAIQEGNNDGNPGTVGDPDWVSLITNPNYPEYNSGATSFATAVTRVLERFFHRDDITFSVTTTNVIPTVQDTRTFQHFSAAAQEVVDARVYSGIHFRFSDTTARKQAIKVADWGFENFLRPQ